MIAPVLLTSISFGLALLAGFSALRFAVDSAIAAAIMAVELYLRKSFPNRPVLKDPYVPLFLAVMIGIATGDVLLGHRERWIGPSWKDGLLLTISGASAAGGLWIVMISSFIQTGLAGKRSWIADLLSFFAACCFGIMVYGVLTRIFPNFG